MLVKEVMNDKPLSSEQGVALNIAIPLWKMVGPLVLLPNGILPIWSPIYYMTRVLWMPLLRAS